jgi:hypothetical protein
MTAPVGRILETSMHSDLRVQTVGPSLQASSPRRPLNCVAPLNSGSIYEYQNGHRRNLHHRPASLPGPT